MVSGKLADVISLGSPWMGGRLMAWPWRNVIGVTSLWWPRWERRNSQFSTLWVHWHTQVQYICGMKQYGAMIAILLDGWWHLTRPPTPKQLMVQADTTFFSVGRSSLFLRRSLTQKKQDAAHEPETNYLNSLVHFPPVTVQVHCKLWNVEKGGVQSAECEESGVLSGKCSV